MMKKNYLLAVALALTAMVGCTDESFVGDQGLKEANEGVGAISFNLTTPAITRADPKTGLDAASDLNSQFIIWGEKNEINAGETGANVTVAPGYSTRAGHLVFENYIVRWTNNSAYTTTSNTKNWEYVGYKYDDSSITPVTTSYSTNISPNTKTTNSSSDPINQTIKYWDYGASSYTFTAFSALPADITDGKVKVTKITSGENVYAKGYTLELGTGASLDNIYFSDRNQPTVGTGTNREATNTYGGNVTMSFRNFMSKIRFGIYETIPGYKVKITNVDYNGTNSTATSKFGVDGKFLTAGSNTAYTITYYEDNKVKAAIKDGTTPDNVGHLETTKSTETLADCPILHTAPTEISTSPATPTYDRTGGTYTTILPFPSNDTNMKVKMDFTLTSEDTGETINVVDATAEIPAAYCQWLPNYAYTYILKLNDNTNGQIGGVTGLYPITFDAVEVTDENGVAEYITTVSEPSITTFGAILNSSDEFKAYQTGKNEYQIPSGSDKLDIYATIVQNNAVVDPLAEHHGYFIYTATGSVEITEASVAEAIAEKDIKRVETPAITVTSYSTGVSLENSGIPAEDGSTKSLTTGKAIKMANITTAGNYVVAYMATEGSATATTADYSASATYYSMTTTAKGFYPLATEAELTTAKDNWATYKSNFTTAPTQPVYVYKVIKVVNP